MRDGYTKDLTFMLGMNTEDGRGNATIYAGYRELKALLQSERDFSACSLTSGGVEFADLTGNNSDNFICAGSSTIGTGRFQAVDNDPQSETYSAEVPGTARTLSPSGALVPYSTAQHACNFAPLNHYQRPDERYTAGLFAHYEFSDSADVYTEFQFMNDETVAQIAGSGLFRFSGPGVGGNYIVNCDNPYLTAEQADLFCTQQGLGPTDDALISIGKRNVEGGGRQDHLEHTSCRAVIGTRGAVADGWRYDIYGLYGTICLVPLPELRTKLRATWLSPWNFERQHLPAGVRHARQDDLHERHGRFLRGTASRIGGWVSGCDGGLQSAVFFGARRRKTLPAAAPRCERGGR